MKAKAKKKLVNGKVKLSLVGMQYRLTISARRNLVQHLPFRVGAVREPGNIQDPNAIAIFVDDKGVPYNGMKLGYLRRQVAEVWAKEIDEGSLSIGKSYLLEVDVDEGLGELLLEVRGNTKSLEIGP